MMMKMKPIVPLTIEEIAKLRLDEEFRRLTGVWPETIVKMEEIQRIALIEKKRKGGRPNKLSVDKMLRMALEYWREYRTYFHIGKSYGLSESNIDNSIENGFSHRAKTPPTQSRLALDFTVLD